MENRCDVKPAISLLVVEDDENSRETLVGILPRKFPGMAVYSAENGRIGLELFKTHTPDIVITDLNMPEMGGAELAFHIRSIKPDTKLIVLTADSQKFTREKDPGEEFQVDHYILKPVYIAALFDLIEQCMARE